MILADQSEDVPIIQCSFKRWARGKGLLGCLDKETADYISQIVSKVKIDGKTFKAWPGGSMGSLRGSLSMYLFKITCWQGKPLWTAWSIRTNCQAGM